MSARNSDSPSMRRTPSITSKPFGILTCFLKFSPPYTDMVCYRRRESILRQAEVEQALRSSEPPDLRPPPEGIDTTVTGGPESSTTCVTRQETAKLERLSKEFSSGLTLPVLP